MMTAMKMRRLGARLALVGVLAVTTAIAGDRPGYSFQSIDNPDAGPLGTSVFGVNSSGVMVGNFEAADGSIRGFVYRKGRFTNVVVPDSVYNDLSDVNSRGMAVGVYFDDQFVGHGYIYSADGTITPFPDVLPGSDTYLYAISDRGILVGSTFSITPEGFVGRGFLYEKGVFTPINVPGASETYPSTITNSGIVAGSYYGADPLLPHGFVLDRDGVFTTIDFPGSVFTLVRGMNERGDIVGSYGDETTRHGFLLRDGVFTTIDVPDASDTDVFDINERGHIVGTYDGYSRGFVAYPSR